MTSEIALPDSDLSTGLEDLDSSDLLTPRLRIKHKDGVFVDSLSLEESNVVYAVLLGIVKQRILWHAVVEDGDAPLCKSPDFERGFPNLEPSDPKRGFPWERTGLAPLTFHGTVSGSTPEEDRSFLACTTCKLKEWGSHPLGEKPYCNEQWTMPILYSTSRAEVEAGGGSLALFTVQRSSIKPARSFATSFARAKRAMYTVIAEISLTQHMKGSNAYSIPSFKKIGDTDSGQWPEYSNQYRTMKQFLVNTIPVPDDEVEAMPKSKDEGSTDRIIDSTVTVDDPWSSGSTPPVSSAADSDLPF